MKTYNKTVAGIACAAVLLIGNAAVAQNIIVNPGFETGDLTGWLTANTSAGATINVLASGGNPAHYAWMDNNVSTTPLVLTQTTPLGSVGPGVTVNYSFDLLGGNQANGGVDFIHIFDKNASDGVISQGPGLLGPFFPPSTSWTHFSGSFVTVAGSDHLTIEFDATTGAAAGSMDQMGVDNVNLSPVVVPEPTTLALAGLGGAAALAFIRRRK